ncbi:HAD-IIIA family hydrolase [bacterium]|nr:HAD-IIIA family hydrolase [bacterium]
MKKYDTIFLDRDGTLNFDPGFVQNVDQFKFYNFTIPALRILSEHGNRFCIVSNQSGVSRGLIDINDLREINSYIRREFIANQINLLEIYYCTDSPEKETNRRKPGTGMFLDAADDYNIELNKCLMIGDSEKDLIPAHNLGMDSMLVLTGNGHLTIDIIEPLDKPTFVVENILEGAKLLIKE